MTDMWTCPSCGRAFASRNQSHTCAALGDLDRHFARASPQVRATFDAVLACVRAIGPVQVLAEKTRIALQVRMSFAAFMPRRDWLNGHLVLARRIDSPRFLRIDTFSPRNVVHVFRLSRPDEVAVQPVAAGHEGREAHPDLQGDPRLLCQHLDRTDGADAGQHRVEGGPDLRAGPGKVPVQVAQGGAGMGLVAAGEAPPAGRARPHVRHRCRFPVRAASAATSRGFR